MKFHRSFVYACSKADTVQADSLEAAVAMDPPDLHIPHSFNADIGDIIGSRIEGEGHNVVYLSGVLEDEETTSSGNRELLVRVAKTLSLIDTTDNDDAAHEKFEMLRALDRLAQDLGLQDQEGGAA